MARPREFDETAVLSAARDAFWTCGYDGTSLHDLTAATGLGKGSLYGAFGTKHDVFVRVFDEYCVGIVASVEEALTGPAATAMDRLASYLRGLANRTADDTERRGCLLAKGPPNWRTGIPSSQRGPGTPTRPWNGSSRGRCARRGGTAP